MCGIVGILGPGSGNFSAENIKNAEKNMEHRGPDSSGDCAGPNFKLHHSRLAISGGSSNKQPIFSSSSNSILAFNGQIYNTAFLISEFGLEANKEDDSKVLVELLEKFGCDAFQHLDGVFAGIYINQEEDKGIIFRDRFGSRPIYIHQGKDFVVAASELGGVKPLIANLTFRKEALMELLTVNMPISEKTHIAEVNRLKPGTALSFSLSTGQLNNVSQYFKYTRNFTKKNQRLSLATSFENAINSQMVRGETAAIYLSSGIDSSLLAIGSSKISDQIKMLTLGYSGNFEDESKQAEDLALQLNAKWENINFDSELFETALSQTIESMQEPRLGQSCVNFLIHKHAKSLARVSYSGAGADELFGGYPWRYPLVVHKGKVRPIKLNLQETAHWISGKWNRVGGNQIVEEICGLARGEAKNYAEKIITACLQDFELDWNDDWASVEACLQYERETFLQNLLSLDDSLAMKSSLEVRVPFLSNDIVSYSESLHPSEFFSFSEERNEILGKMPLRNLLADLGFSERSSGKKLGFGAPLDIWKESIFNYILKNADKNLFNVSLNEIQILSEKLTARESQGLLWSVATTSCFFKYIEK